mgnify:CR=1 FL=1
MPDARFVAVVADVADVALVAVAVALSMRGKDAAAPDAAPQAPVVTVLTPGQTMVARTVSSTGSLAARVDMPVGVVGEGGMVTRVLVQPGDPDDYARVRDLQKAMILRPLSRYLAGESGQNPVPAQWLLDAGGEGIHFLSPDTGAKAIPSLFT